MPTIETLQRTRRHEKNKKEILAPNPELIRAVDEAFIERVGDLGKLQINPELERQLGAWVKQPGDDRTAGVKSEA